MVLEAGGADAAVARQALAELCQTYWLPIYTYIRRRGSSPHDAQDLTQEFFARLLEQNLVAAADPGRGRFRSFLLGALNHFLAKEWRKGRAQKRGGHLQIVELGDAELRYGSEPVTPEQQFERKWAVTLLDAVLERLRAEFADENRPERFELLRPFLLGDREGEPYAVIASRLGMSDGAIKVAVHRLRCRYRRLLREEVARTVAAPDQVEAEMRHLLAVLAAG